jgi:hypothetical protein
VPRRRRWTRAFWEGQGIAGTKRMLGAARALDFTEKTRRLVLAQHAEVQTRNEDDVGVRAGESEAAGHAK